MKEITQALEAAHNRNRVPIWQPAFEAKWQSTWLTDKTKTYTGSLDELLGHVQTLGIETVLQNYPLSRKVYYDLRKGDVYAGLIEQVELAYEKELAPEGWLAIILKDCIQESELTMNPTTTLIINIKHPEEPHLYTVRLKEGGEILTGFETIQQVDHWLKMSGGQFTGDPVETPQGFWREAVIATWAYNQMVQAQKAQTATPHPQAPQAKAV